MDNQHNDDMFMFTEKGLFMVMEMHQKVLDDWTLEQIAEFYDLEVLGVRIQLACLYSIAEVNGIDLGIYVPDTIEALDE